MIDKTWIVVGVFALSLLAVWCRAIGNYEFELYSEQPSPIEVYVGEKLLFDAKLAKGEWVTKSVWSVGRAAYEEYTIRIPGRADLECEYLESFGGSHLLVMITDEVKCDWGPTSNMLGANFLFDFGIDWLAIALLTICASSGFALARNIFLSSTYWKDVSKQKS